jgi:glycolate oxidase iron-sulfur subunit
MRHLPFMLMGGRWIPPLAKESVLEKYKNSEVIPPSPPSVKGGLTTSYLGKKNLITPSPGKENFATSFFKSKNSKTPSSPKETMGDPQMRVGFYVGCLINYIYTDIADAVIEVLNHFGAEVVIPQEQLCCGIPARSLGATKTARKLAEANIAVFEKANVDFIITACATCGRTLKRDYHLMLGDRSLNFIGKVHDVSEFIEKYFTYETKFLDTKITYHDPCHLYWGQNISKQPRDILRRSAKFQEMENPERCCGGGGVFNLLHYDLSMKIGEYKARAIEKSGAEVVATGCPGCRLQIEDLLALRDSAIKCIHTIQILRDALLKAPNKI